MRNRRYEQGGVVSFLIVTIVLAVLLGAGIWWAKRLQSPVVTLPAPDTTVTTPYTTPSPDTDANASDTTVQGGTTNDQSTSGGQSSSGTGSQGTIPSPSTTPSTGPSTPEVVVSTGPTVSEIPSTGPADAVFIVLALGAVSAGTYYFVASTKRLRTSALK